MHGQTRIEFIFGIVIFAIIVFYIVTQINTVFSTIISDYEINNMKAEALNSIINLVETGDIEKQYEAQVSVDVMLVNDISGSMGGTKLQAAKDAAKYFIMIMDNTTDRSGLATFNNTAYLDQGLTFENATVAIAIDAMIAQGMTGIGFGIDEANTELINNDRIDAIKVEILLSDGKENQVSDPLGKADQADAYGISIYTIGLGGDADHDLLEDIANNTDGKYYFAPSESQLEEIYEDIAFEIKVKKTRVGLLANRPYNLSEEKVEDLNENCDMLDKFDIDPYRLRIYKSTELVLFCGIDSLKPPKVSIMKYILVGNVLGNLTLELW